MDQTSITSADEIMTYKFWHLLSAGISKYTFTLLKVPVHQESRCIAFPTGRKLLEQVTSAAKSSKGYCCSWSSWPSEGNPVSPGAGQGSGHADGSEEITSITTF